MRTFTPIVLAVLAILLLAAGAVAAHANDGNTTGHDDVPVNGSAADWAAWMEQHMTEHMAAHHDGSMMDGMTNGRMMGGMMNGGTSGMGCH